MPPLNDQSDENESLNKFLVKLGFYKQGNVETVNTKKGIIGLFK